MIYYIEGKVAELQPTYAVIDCAGVGYELNITLTDYTTIEKSPSIRLYVHESIREDAHVLYGFITKKARDIFRLLIGVSGVGPNTARLILSAMTADQVESTIASGNDTMLKSVKGIGAKTAQRIIVDLKDKIKVEESALINSQPLRNEAYDEALAALVTLGFNPLQSKKALGKLFAADPGLTTEEAVKQSIKLM